MIKSALCLISCILLLYIPASAQNYIDLLNSASSFEIVRIVNDLPQNSQIIYDIPCISPVQTRDFDRLHISSQYGRRIHPITQRIHMHSGIDIPPTGNDTIYVAANGVIDTIAYNDKLGLYIRVSHRFGYQTIYGHLSHILIHDPHQIVRIGQPIAIMGTTGRSTGKHLHYTILHHAKSIPPLPYCYLFIEIQRRK